MVSILNSIIITCCDEGHFLRLLFSSAFSSVVASPIINNYAGGLLLQTVYYEVLQNQTLVYGQGGNNSMTLHDAGRRHHVVQSVIVFFDRNAVDNLLIQGNPDQNGRF